MTVQVTSPERDWDKLFDEMYLRTYLPRQPPEHAEYEAECVVQLAGIEIGDRILDMPCGYGRHSIPLARKGHTVIAADKSAVLLAEAERRAEALNTIEFLRADYRAIPLPAGAVDVVLNLFTSLGFYGRDTDRVVLSEFRRVLKPSGRLLVEVGHRDYLVRNSYGRTWAPLPDDEVVLEERDFDGVHGILEKTDTVIASDGARESVTYRFRTYTATEFRDLLLDAGFVDLEFFGDFDGRAFDTHGHLLILAKAPHD